MNIPQKFSVSVIIILLLLVTACSSAATATQTKTLDGYWMDNGGNSTTIVFENNEYMASTVYYMMGARSQNTLISASNDNGVLTWKYCPPPHPNKLPCITLTTVAFNGDTLDVTWANDNGESGTMTLTRTNKGNPWQ